MSRGIHGHRRGCILGTSVYTAPNNDYFINGDLLDDISTIILLGHAQLLSAF